MHFSSLGIVCIDQNWLILECNQTSCRFCVFITTIEVAVRSINVEVWFTLCRLYTSFHRIATIAAVGYKLMNCMLHTVDTYGVLYCRVCAVSTGFGNGPPHSAIIYCRMRNQVVHLQLYILQLIAQHT